jgi:hypothetical protein
MIMKKPMVVTIIGAGCDRIDDAARAGVSTLDISSRVSAGARGHRRNPSLWPAAQRAMKGIVSRRLFSP